MSASARFVWDGRPTLKPIRIPLTGQWVRHKDAPSDLTVDGLEGPVPDVVEIADPAVAEQMRAGSVWTEVDAAKAGSKAERTARPTDNTKGS